MGLGWWWRRRRLRGCGRLRLRLCAQVRPHALIVDLADLIDGTAPAAGGSRVGDDRIQVRGYGRAGGAQPDAVGDEAHIARRPDLQQVGIVRSGEYHQLILAERLPAIVTAEPGEGGDRRTGVGGIARARLLLLASVQRDADGAGTAQDEHQGEHDGCAEDSAHTRLLDEAWCNSRTRP